jgi:hypothetical protein
LAQRLTTASLAAIVLMAAWSFAIDARGRSNGHTYWVSSSGSASWDRCQSAAPLSGTSACALATANRNAEAGDTVHLRGGTYHTAIRPVRSGTADRRLTYQGHAGETATITNVGNTGGIELNGVDYVTVTNVTVAETYQLVNITNGSSYNEIARCVLRKGTGPANNGVNILTINATEHTRNTHNWIHHCRIYEAGYVGAKCNDAGGLISIGADGAMDGISDYNTIEDNEIYWGAHHALKVNTRFNVVRNNFIHNEGHFAAPESCRVVGCAPGGVYGNRVLTVLNNHRKVPAWYSDTYNLIERNRLGSAAVASDGNGADNLTLGGERDIARYNTIFNAMETGIYFRNAGNLSNFNRVYNNTIAYNGQGPQCRVERFPGFWKGGVRIPRGARHNALKNNILYGNDGREWWDRGTDTIAANNWLTRDGNPQFVDATLSDPTSATTPDLSLRPGSPAIDKGMPLTHADGSGVNSKVLRVDDALYFQYGERGSSLSKIEADVIALETVTNVVRIQAIDYGARTITLETPRTWKDRAPIWLARASDGTIVLKGPAPDQGAHESATPAARATPRILSRPW